MQDKMWDLQMAMDAKLDTLAENMCAIKDRLDSSGGVCDQVRENSKRIAIHEEYISNQKANMRFLKRMAAIASSVAAGVVALLEFVLKVKVF